MTQSIVQIPSPGATGRLSLPWAPLFAPSRIFEHPQHVVTSDLTLEERRTILAAWASDANVVESAPGLRHCPGLMGRYVSVDAVLNALRSLDPVPEREASEDPSPERPTGKQVIRWLSPRVSRGI